jgi:hypothetical protein
MDSWGKFIESYLITSVNGSTTVVGACDQAALVGGDGTVWAATSGFNLDASKEVEVSKEDGTTEKIKVNEFDNIKDAVEKKGDASKMKKGGVHLLGNKYVVTDGFEGEGYYTQYFKSTNGGAAVTKTGAGNYIIGTYDTSKKASVTKDDNTKEAKQSVGFCNNAVDNLSKVLVQSNL